MLTLNILRTHNVSSKRIIGDFNTFDNKDQQSWDIMYSIVMDKKYAKNTRNFSRNITGVPFENGEAPIYVVPRIRTGPSYLSIPLIGVNIEHVQYCPISKGFPMQDVSSFTLGPIVGEGLCLVNAAFSKSICVAHIEGGGIVDFKRKNFWRRAKKPHLTILVIDNENILVDGIINNAQEWLRRNEHLWYPQWEIWRQSIALCSKGDFHWTDGLGETIAYHKDNRYLNFVQWKKECYIQPSYELLPQTTVFQFLQTIWRDNNIPLGLVHPKGMSDIGEYPITREFIRNMYDSSEIMCCQPYVVAGKLLDVPIYD
ncbi:Hypothetical protein HVR_LOCUS393 [uncultured virus]|nr:Hypothetical protein HVR_LOCUS393 [uncultured virus]